MSPVRFLVAPLAESDTKHLGAIAQLVEQRTENPCVPGSIPGGTTAKKSKTTQNPNFQRNWDFLFSPKTQSKIRLQTVEENLLETVIGLPANLFYGTGIPAAIAIFNKEKKGDNVLFIDASHEFENGKNQNRLSDADIEHIVSTYHAFADGKLLAGVAEEKYAYVATQKEIEKNDYNLNIPRYVDTYEEEAEIDLVAVQQEINALETELTKVQTKMKEYLKELGM